MGSIPVPRIFIPSLENQRQLKIKFKSPSISLIINMENQPQSHSKSTYDKIYKWLLIIPVGFLLFSLVYLVQFNSQNGDIIYKDVSITGGTTISVFDDKIDIEAVTKTLKSEFSDISIRGISDIRTGKQQGFILETKASPDSIKPALENYLGYKITQDNSSIEFSGASLSSGFYKQIRFAIIIAFVLMALVVLVIFRTVIPSFAVILSAFADIIMTITIVDILGITLSTAGIIAFLMLVGYSVDTDILLTTTLLKKKEGTLNERMLAAFKTGMTMTLTSIAAVTVSLIIIYNFSETLRQIFTILLIGLFLDMLNTWLTNASMLKWYMEVKNIK